MAARSSVLHAGNPYAMLRAIDGGSISVGVLGASVAQNAGCYDQAKRCGEYDGKHKKRSGFLVDFVERLRRSEGGRLRVNLFNAAVDASPIHSVLDCLCSHLPRRVDAVVLEPASMAQFVTAEDLGRVVDAVRALEGRPHLIFVIFHEWLHHRSRTFYAEFEDTPWQRMEDAALKLCRRHNYTCLSPRRELYPVVNRSHARLYDFVGRDGLHIVHSRLGVGFVADVLWRWYTDARSAVLSEPEEEGRPSLRTLAPEPASCYRFAGSPRRFRPLQWSTAACPSCAST